VNKYIHIKNGLLACFILSLINGCAASSHTRSSSYQNQPSSSYATHTDNTDYLKLFSEAFTRIQQNYYQTIAPNILLGHAAEGILKVTNLTYAQVGVSPSVFSSHRTSHTLSPENKSELPLRPFADLVIRVKQFRPDLQDRELYYAAIRGMMTGLDKQSTFMDEEESKILFTGRPEAAIGLVLKKIDNAIVVIEPLENSPGLHAGIKSGDTILAIDGHTTADMSLDKVIHDLRGKPGTSVKLDIMNTTGNKQSILVYRDIIKRNPVKSRLLDGGIGYIKLLQFTEHATKALKAQLYSLQQQHGRPLQGLILDLRNNTGGLLNTAVEITDVFLAGGPITTIQGRGASDITNYNAEPTGYNAVGEHIKLVILINEKTASGAEILAAAMQDNNRAVVLGRQTDGHGKIQSVVVLHNRTLLKLTTAIFTRKGNKAIDGVGVLPDICIQGKRSYRGAKRNKRVCGKVIDSIKTDTDDELDIAVRELTHQLPQQRME